MVASRVSMAETLASRWYRCKTKRAARRWTVGPFRVMLVGSRYCCIRESVLLGIYMLAVLHGVSDVDVSPQEV